MNSCGSNGFSQSKRLFTHDATYKRNVCVIAHVDHGKTSLCDYLISTSGILDADSAGDVRYLDSREDEQRRLITMKASCISLSYTVMEGTVESYLVNLVDSPGHVDFSSDISSSVSLTDGALFLVDVVEGIRSQTKQVAEIAFNADLKFILILNKMDKLFTELRMNAEEVVNHVSSLLNEVNNLFLELQRKRQSANVSTSSTLDNVGKGNRYSETKDNYFRPELGNVIFASAYHGWAFDVECFSKQLASKYNLNDQVCSKLTKAFWGGFYLNKKTWSVSSKPFYPQQTSMNIQLIFKPLWQMYQWTTLCPDLNAVEKCFTSLNIKYDKRQLALGKRLTKFIFSRWLPLGKKLFETIIYKLPCPKEISSYRILSLIPGSSTKEKALQSLSEIDSFSSHSNVSPDVFSQYVKECSLSSNCPVILYISKFVKANLKSFTLAEPETKSDILSAESEKHEEETFIGFSRVFSGLLTQGMELYICNQKTLRVHISKEESEEQDSFGSCRFNVGCTYIENKEPYNQYQRPKVCIRQLFIIQGIDLLPVEKAPAGCIVAVSVTGLNDTSELSEPINCDDQSLNAMSTFIWKKNVLSKVHRSITLSSDSRCPALSPPHTPSSMSLISVHVESKQIGDFQKLLDGLLMLYKSDPSTDIDITQQGELLLKCCGEVHLQKCKKDLEHFCPAIPIQCKLLSGHYSSVPTVLCQVSSPIVTLRESLYGSLPDEKIKTSSSSSNVLNSSCTAVPFPPWSMDKKNVALQVNSELPVNKLQFSKISIKPQLDSQDAFSVQVLAQPIPGQVLLFLDSSITELEAQLRYFPYDSGLHTIQKTVEDLWKPLSDTQSACLSSLHPPACSLYYDVDRTNELKLSKRPPQGLLIGISLARGSRTLLYLNSQISDPFNTNFPCSEVPLFFRPFLGCTLSGFYLASQMGPLTEEPIVGVAYTIEVNYPLKSIESKKIEANEKLTIDGKGAEIFSLETPPGHMISWTKEACKRAVLQRGRMRVFEAMLRLEMICDQTVLGKSYSVLSKRCCRIASEESIQGMSSFCVNAFVPISQSFGLVSELRSKASGHIELQLQFSHWEMNPEEPFPESCLTYENLETEGAQCMKNASYTASCRSRRLIYEIRKRKGLPLDEKVIVDSNKQRTLTRNK